MDIKDIPEDHYKGERTVALELPWLTPESIIFLDNILKPHFKVLEFGSGGSTLFFSRRCQEVTSFETNPQWMDKMKDTIHEKSLNNIYYYPIEDYREICKGKDFDCILIDTADDAKVKRADLMHFSLGILKTGGLIIMDNYGSYTYNVPSEFSEKAFDNVHWWGKGTKIYSSFKG